MNKILSKISFIPTLLFFLIANISHAQTESSPRTGNTIKKIVVSYAVLKHFQPTIQKIVKDNPKKYKIVYTTAPISQSQYNQLSPKGKKFVDKHPDIYQVSSAINLPQVQLPTNLN